MIFKTDYLIYGIVIFIILISLLLLHNIFKKRIINELNYLLSINSFDLYFELLKNKRISLFFSKNSLLLFELEGFLHSGENEKVENSIKKLDSKKLKSVDLFLFHQKRFSYYILINNEKESLKSLNVLRNIFKSQTEETRKIIEDANIVYQVYIKKNTKLIPKLIYKESIEINPFNKGLIQYKIAKLYYYQNNIDKVKHYLKKADKNLLGTYWDLIIKEALSDPSILLIK